MHNHETDLDFTTHPRIFFRLFRQLSSDRYDRHCVFNNLFRLFSRLIGSCPQLSKTSLVTVIVELEEHILRTILVGNNRPLATFKIEQLDTTAVHLVNARWQRF